MNCPECGAKAAVYWSQTKPDAVKRNHKCPQGHKFTTVEVCIPTGVYKPEARLTLAVRRIWPNMLFISKR